jgi:metal-sulfur cluster biosynthetic enzyme
VSRRSDAEDRRHQVEQILNTVVDPCSEAAGVPLGLIDMGIVESVAIDGDAVSVTLLPTFPGCIYTAIFADEIARRVGELDSAAAVSVELSTTGSIWDEERMTPAAQELLAASRRRQRLRLAAAGS